MAAKVSVEAPDAVQLTVDPEYGDKTASYDLSVADLTYKVQQQIISCCQCVLGFGGCTANNGCI